jgi:hypothetical protein
MNAPNKLIKSSTLALALATLFVGSFQISAAEHSSLLWAEHFKDACKAGELSQASVSLNAFRAFRYGCEAKHRAGLGRAFQTGVHTIRKPGGVCGGLRHQSVATVAPARKVVASC